MKNMKLVKGRGACAACGRSTRLPIHSSCGKNLQVSRRRPDKAWTAKSIAYFAKRFG
jgi:hypothetical protein